MIPTNIMKYIPFYIAIACLCSCFESTAQEDYSMLDVDSCDFESECHLIILPTAEDNIWEIGQPGKVFFDSAHSITKAMVTDTDAYYQPNNHSYFDLEIETFSYPTNKVVTFWHKYDTDTLLDGGYLEISYDTGSTWYPIHEAFGIIYMNDGEVLQKNFYSEADTLLGGIPGFSGNSGGWVETRLILVYQKTISTAEEYFGEGKILLRFNFISDDTDNEKEGWMIDDITIGIAWWPESIDGLSLNNLPFRAYPNPSSGTIRIAISNDNNSSDTYDLKVYNMFGMIVYQDKISDQQLLDLGSFPKGQYLLQISDVEGRAGTSKIIIQ